MTIPAYLKRGVAGYSIYFITLEKGGSMLDEGLLQSIINEYNKKRAYYKSRNPDQIFRDATDAGLGSVIEHLHDAITVLYKSNEDKDKEIKTIKAVAEKNENDFRRKLNATTKQCVVLSKQIGDYQKHLQRQAAAEEGRRKELAKFKDKAAKIEACLTKGCFPENEDIKIVLNEIKTILNA